MSEYVVCEKAALFGGLTRMSDATVLKVLAEYKIHHCVLLFREARMAVHSRHV